MTPSAGLIGVLIGVCYLIMFGGMVLLMTHRSRKFDDWERYCRACPHADNCTDRPDRCEWRAREGQA